MADPVRITVLEGDETGQELLEQALRVLDPELLELPIELERFDLSLERRQATENEVVRVAAKALRASGLGIKAATITPEGADDVGSPNRLLREEVDGKVIVRTGRRLPGVTPVAGVHHPIAVVRMAVEDAYGAEQWREGPEGGADEVAYRREKVTRSTCRAVAEYAFRTAERMHARSTAARSGRFPRSTRACSRRRWTPPRGAIPTSPTSRFSSTPRTPA